MVTRRMRRRHRLLDAYVRLELDDRGVLSEEGRDGPEAETTHEVPEVAERSADGVDDGRTDIPA